MYTDIQILHNHNISQYHMLFAEETKYNIPKSVTLFCAHTEALWFELLEQIQEQMEQLCCVTTNQDLRALSYQQESLVLHH